MTLSILCPQRSDMLPCSLVGLRYAGILGTLLLLCLPPSPSLAAVLVMTNGDRLTGTVESWDKGLLKYKTEYAHVIEIDWDKVQTLTTEKDVVVLTDDEALYRGRMVFGPETDIEIYTSDGKVLTVESEHIAYINPEDWRIGSATKRSGHLNFSLKADRGNADKDEIDLDADFTARRQRDRFSLFGQLEYDTNKGDTTKYTWDVLGKYDQFVTKKRYYSLNGFIEHDKGKGIELRYYVGPAIGYQIFEDETKNLRAEWGLYWTTTDLVDTDRRSSLGTGWFVDYDHYIFKRFIQAYHRQSAVLSDRENMNLRSKTGLRFPIADGFLASAELEANWDADTAPNTDGTEVIYRIKLGYGW